MQLCKNINNILDKKWQMIKCSIGIMAYNEGANIERLLKAIITQKTHITTIGEIIVVSSGSSDRTEEIVKKFSKIDNRIKLITQKSRMGKALAINIFLKNAKNKICILVNADTILEKEAIETLVQPFTNPEVGMTGGHPLPVNSPDNFVGYICHFMWKLHHKISLKSPKMGELIAIRKDAIDKIPEKTAVDEVCIESIMKKNGYNLVYVPDSKVYIKGPETVRDFIRQRRRIATGHIWAKKHLGYVPSTRNKWLTIKLTFSELSWNPRVILFIFGAVFLECLSRILGIYDYYIKGKNPYLWDIITSTKNLK